MQSLSEKRRNGMLVISRKIKTGSIPENACPECEGTGERELIGPVVTVTLNCSFCNGERIVTQDLLDRRALADRLTDLMSKADLTIREAVHKFGHNQMAAFREWADAKQGRAPINQIQEKIDLIVKDMA
jgi:excinuclease UvrABC ATPase subunit